MQQFWIVDLLMEAGGGAGQGQGQGAQPGPGDFLRTLLVPMAIVFLIFWLLIFRPESRKRKDRERKVAAVKKGDTVVTSGGLLGKVWRVDGGEVIVVIDKDRDVKARFTKSAILDVLGPESLAKGDNSSESSSS